MGIFVVTVKTYYLSFFSFQLILIFRIVLDYHTVAKGYGGHGFLMKRGSDIKEILTNAQKLAKDTEKPVLLNCLIGKTNFREGSISV